MRSPLLFSELNDSPVRAFLSFATSDKSLVEDFKDQLMSRYANLELLDHAVIDHYDKNWKLECAQKIDRSTILMCLIGATTHTSEAVAWEIDRGLTRGVPVVAVKLIERKVRVPNVLIRNSINPIPYNAIRAPSTYDGEKLKSVANAGV